MESLKPVHTLVLDTGAIIKNDPPVSTLLKQCENIVTVPAIISEIKDAATRSRVQTTLQPFLTLRSPNPKSLKFVADFARRTGDLGVLSKADLLIIALTYEIECERNGGDWRLRRLPGQKGLNGAPPAKPSGDAETKDTTESTSTEASSLLSPATEPSVSKDIVADQHIEVSDAIPRVTSIDTDHVADLDSQQPSTAAEDALTEGISKVTLDKDDTKEATNPAPKVDSAQNSSGSQEDSESDSEGWITPSNLAKKQAQDADSSTVQTPEPKTMQVAVLTTDFAMQNVILQMNLNLLSTSLARVKHLKTFVLRCHACFQITKDMGKQFCPKCGQPSMTRVACSTNTNGEFKLHLKKNMQWNNRGDRYSIPKPVHGSANGRVKGGGKDGWGNQLMLTEDQKEYERAVNDQRRSKERNLMDEDYLPGILTGDRGREGGRIKVGAGRNVNARKR